MFKFLQSEKFNIIKSRFNLFEILNEFNIF